MGKFTSLIQPLSLSRRVLSMIDGMIYYRVHGEGWHKGLFPEEGPLLTPEQRTMAIEARRRIKAIQKALDEHTRELNELCGQLDEFMCF